LVVILVAAEIYAPPRNAAAEAHRVAPANVGHGIQKIIRINHRRRNARDLAVVV